ERDGRVEVARRARDVAQAQATEASLAEEPGVGAGSDLDRALGLAERARVVALQPREPGAVAPGVERAGVEPEGLVEVAASAGPVSEREPRGASHVPRRGEARVELDRPPCRRRRAREV